MTATDATSTPPPSPSPWDPQVLPTFFVLGAAKAGTSTLAAMLADHPEIFIPPVKELGFFSVHEIWDRGLDDYQRTHFAGAEPRRAVARGDATPSYLCSPDAAARAAGLLPPASQRFVVLLRDPVARAHSHYLHMHRTGAEDASFAVAVQEDEARVAADDLGTFNSCYVYGSRYAQHLQRWQETFPDGELLVVLMDDLTSDPAATMRRVHEFLGVDPSVHVEARHENAGGAARLGLFKHALNAPPWMKKGWDKVLTPVAKQKLGLLLLRLDRKEATPDPIDPALDASLRELFADDIAYVEELTGRDLSAWRTPKG